MSATETLTRATANVFEGVTPILRVYDLPASIHYYVNVLGFKIDFQQPGIIASVSRDRCGIFLIQGDQGNPGTWVWIGVGDVESLFDEYQKKGAKVRHPPTNYPLGRMRCRLRIPTETYFVSGSEPKEDQPVGEWLDMHGRTWATSPDGVWTRVEFLANQPPLP